MLAPLTGNRHGRNLHTPYLNRRNTSCQYLFFGVNSACFCMDEPLSGSGVRVAARLPRKQVCEGSSPFGASIFASIAQLGERLFCKQEVAGSMPAAGSIEDLPLIAPIDRRAFLRRLGFGSVAVAAVATGLVDVEKLLWVPGEKTIIIPALEAVETFGNTFITPQWVTREALRILENNLVFASGVTRFYDDDYKSGSSIHVPHSLFGRRWIDPSKVRVVRRRPDIRLPEFYRS